MVKKGKKLKLKKEGRKQKERKYYHIVMTVVSGKVLMHPSTSILILPSKTAKASPSCPGLIRSLFARCRPAKTLPSYSPFKGPGSSAPQPPLPFKCPAHRRKHRDDNPFYIIPPLRTSPSSFELFCNDDCRRSYRGRQCWCSMDEGSGNSGQTLQPVWDER